MRFAVLFSVFLALTAFFLMSRNGRRDPFATMVMPGALSAAHSKTETQCTLCHAPFRKGGQDDLCLKCHQDVAADLRTGSGFHGKAASAGLCSRCHEEHRGRAHALVALDRTAFDHALTDYPLKGAHAAGRVACEACHAAGRKFRDARTDCSACHAKDDKHQGRLGQDCAKCHRETAWTDASFDHAGTRFPLKGRHREAACAACHASPTFSGASSACADCHGKDDVHEGALGRSCGQCHGEEGWKQGLMFDHDLTGFPLVGLHAAVSCGECHRTKTFRDASAACASCHAKDDVHHGTLGTSCNACHNPNGWARWEFDHDSTRYKLLGKHAGLRCAACHRAAGGKAPTACVECHSDDDAHAGRFGDRCDRCHTPEDFRKVIRV